MFTGIIEAMVPLVAIKKSGKNIDLEFETALAQELEVDQSVAHNGVCLTVTAVTANRYSVTAIDETLRLTNLGDMQIGEFANFERCMRLSDRLDGHIVQGHVDGMGKVLSVESQSGSWIYTIAHELDHRLIIPKGSITINGVSLTVISSEKGKFSVAIIPHTFDKTNFQFLKKGSKVNLEPDILGKYVQRMLNH